MRTSDLPRPQKVLLFVLDGWEELREQGLVTGGRDLTPRGRALLDQLKAEGFRPTGDEIRACVAYLKKRPQ